MSAFDEVYRRASIATGRPEQALHQLADQVFASMLNHALENPGEVIDSIIRIDRCQIDVEVNVPRRKTAIWSMTPTDPPLKVLEGEAYESRDVKCGRCGTLFRSAPWPKSDFGLTHRPRCSHCHSSFTYPIAK